MNKTNLIAAMILLSLTASCSPKVEKNVEVSDPSTGEKTNISVSKSIFGDNETKFTNKEDGSTVAVSSGKIPKDFPKFITVYPNASDVTTIDASNGSDEDKKMTMLNFKTADGGDKIIEFYKKQVEAHGFTEKGKAVMGPMNMSSFINPTTNQALQVVAAKGEGGEKNSVQIIYAKELSE